MRSPDCVPGLRRMRPSRGLASLAGLLLTACLLVAACGGGADPEASDAAFRYRAPIEVSRAAPFVVVPLGPDAYARSLRDDLRDVRVVDARGERVPFALLGPRAHERRTDESTRDAALYALPPRPAAGGAWPSPVELTIDGERISVRRSAAAGESTERSPGWLFDLGERKPGMPPPDRVRVVWSGPSEFTAAYDLETSDDLRAWRPAGSGQLLALASDSGPLTQPDITLPRAAGRFVRLSWADAPRAPRLTAAIAITDRPRAVAVDPPRALVVAPGEEPQPGRDRAAAETRRALHFDLGGVLPLVAIDLRRPGATWVSPVRIQGRSRVDESWRELARTVFYRLERGGAVSTSPAVEVGDAVRYLRIVPDERSAALDTAHTRLEVQVRLASVVFATQGEAPYALLAGDPKAAASALPIGTLVPSLDDERARFGAASLGAWSELEAVARQVEARERAARLRPWLLWSVLAGAVALLAFMVWRLMRQGSRP